MSTESLHELWPESVLEVRSTVANDTLRYALVTNYFVKEEFTSEFTINGADSRNEYRIFREAVDDDKQIIEAVITLWHFEEVDSCFNPRANRWRNRMKQRLSTLVRRVRQLTDMAHELREGVAQGRTRRTGTIQGLRRF